MYVIRTREVGGVSLKLTVYIVAIMKDTDTLIELTYETKEAAIKRAEDAPYNGFHYEYLGPREIEVNLHCNYCDKELHIGDDYIKLDTKTRYCADCYEATSFTYYTVNGESVGDETNVKVYDGLDKEV